MLSASAEAFGRPGRKDLMQDKLARAILVVDDEPRLRILASEIVEALRDALDQMNASAV
jgi:hypothetical protein